MIKIILLGICMVTVIAHPGLFLLAIGVAVVCFLMVISADKNVAEVSSTAKESQDVNSDLYVVKDFVTEEEKIAAGLKGMFKPGFKQDEKWKATSKALKDQVEKAQYREYLEREGLAQNSQKDD
jgi:hypothetical protein